MTDPRDPSPDPPEVEREFRHASRTMIATLVVLTLAILALYLFAVCQPPEKYETHHVKKQNERS